MFVTKAHHEEVVRQLEARISDLKEMLAQVRNAAVVPEPTAVAAPKIRKPTGVIDRPSPFDHLGNRIVPEEVDELEQATTALEAMAPEVLRNPRLVTKRMTRNLARTYHASEMENAVRKQFEKAEQDAKKSFLEQQAAEKKAEQSSEKVG